MPLPSFVKSDRGSKFGTLKYTKHLLNGVVILGCVGQQMISIVGGDTSTQPLTHDGGSLARVMPHHGASAARATE